MLEFSGGAIFFWGVATGTILGVSLMAAWGSSREDNHRYVPPEAEVVTKNDWKRIERGIAVEIGKAKNAGIKLGRAQIIKAVEDSLADRKDKRKNPWEILGIKPGEETMAEEKAEELKSYYNPSNFDYLDNTFVELARLKTEEVDVALGKIRKYLASGGILRSRGDI